jgi:hypothetical protein
MKETTATIIHAARDGPVAFPSNSKRLELELSTTSPDEADVTTILETKPR